jgi:HSP20 family molecular chaperone IbpA
MLSFSKPTCRGVKQEDVRIEIENNHLVLRGSRCVESGLLTGRFHIMERSSGYFVRRIKLPQSVDNDTVSKALLRINTATKPSAPGST